MKQVIEYQNVACEIWVMCSDVQLWLKLFVDFHKVYICFLQMLRLMHLLIHPKLFEVKKDFFFKKKKNEKEKEKVRDRKF